MKPLSLKADLTVQQAFDDESHCVEIKTYQLLMKWKKLKMLYAV